MALAISSTSSLGCPASAGGLEVLRLLDAGAADVDEEEVPASGSRGLAKGFASFFGAVVLSASSTVITGVLTACLDFSARTSSTSSGAGCQGGLK